MAIEFKLPDLGEGIHEAEVLAVKVKEGDSIREDQAIFEVETDKAVVEIPSPVTGTVQKIYVKAGQIISVGTVMVTFETAATGTTPRKEEKETTAPVKVAANIHRETTVRQGVVDNGQGNDKSSSGTTTRSVPATPATRRLARELGVDLRLVRPTGPGGRVLNEDVRSFAAGSLESSMAKELSASTSSKSSLAQKPESLRKKYGGDDQAESGAIQPFAHTASKPSQLPDFSKYGPVERIPLRSIRRKIALSMAESWAHIPHVTHFDEANITPLQRFLSKHSAEVKEHGGRLTVTVFVLKALARALVKYPQFNASLDEASGELVFKHYYNIGVAVATERGLIVPVIKDVDKKSLSQLCEELPQLAEKTRAFKVEPDQLQGGTFTLTNIGAIGGTNMSPMIRYPEAAILGIARAAEKPIVKDGKVEIGTILPLALSFDHRIADGAEAAYFVQHVVSTLEEPLTLLLEK
jgi:pyruvate dehydrogenase E2 component (dihydrolipoamide acetyltransferase)